MKIQLPIEASGVSFIDVMRPEPLIDHETKQQKTDANGEPLYSIELACIGAEGGQVLTVNFPGDPPTGIRRGMPMKVTGLMVTDWATENRFGLTFQAAAVEPHVGRGQNGGAA